jgi:pimeloyl-ACP methyl ester carboxylesterase
MPKLPMLTLPALLLWGDSDRSCTPAYGKAYARALADARFQLIAKAGHLPHIEQPGATFAAIDSFLARSA